MVSVFRNRPYSAWLVAASLAASLAASPALANDSETSRARATFQEGRSLEVAGNYAAALGKFQDVAQVRRTAQVVFHIAYCQERIGRLVEALGNYRLASTEAEGAKLADVRKAADTAGAALEKRIPTIAVRIGSGSEPASVALDGVLIGSGSVATPMRVNPGAHTVDATMPGREPFRTVVSVTEAESKTVDVMLAAPAPAPPPPLVVAVAPAAPERPVATRRDNESSAGAWPYVVTGLGVAGAGAAVAMFVVRRNALDELDAACIRGICPASERATGDRGKRAAVLGDVFVGVGVVSIGIGSYLFLRDAREPSSASAHASRALDLRLRPEHGGAAATLVGTF